MNRVILQFGLALCLLGYVGGFVAAQPSTGAPVHITGEILDKVLISVGSALLLSLLSLLFSSVRTAIFFKSTEYEFVYSRGTGSCEWDIQWEDYRLTISTESVSNDYLKNVVVCRNKRKDVNLQNLVPSNTFVPLFDNEIQLKLDSIVRRQQGPAADYAARFVFRRRRLGRKSFG